LNPERAGHGRPVKQQLSGKALGTVLLAFLAATVFITNAHPVLAYTPQKGDSFDYSETITVNDGQGSYTGYMDQTQINGMEQMNAINGNNISASYSYSSQFSNNQGSTTSDSKSGVYNWSASSYTYINGSDNQVGYSRPTYVWFSMNPSLAVGGTFHVLNTQFAVLSKNYSLRLPTEGNRYVQTIQTKGTGQYQRNDDYGVFSASFTWYEYFDPGTGYIVGYSYVEQDSGQYQGQAGSFTYNDTLYVTSTSYGLTLAIAPGTTSTSSGAVGSATSPVLLVGLVVVILVLGVVAFAATRRRRRESLPKHPYAPQTPPPAPPAPWESKIDLGSKPTEEVVIRDVAKVNCKYCGTLIPTTADKCPYCGGPRQ